MWQARQGRLGLVEDICCCGAPQGGRAMRGGVSCRARGGRQRGCAVPRQFSRGSPVRVEVSRGQWLVGTGEGQGQGLVWGV